jgi:hypothetical protein
VWVVGDVGSDAYDRGAYWHVLRPVVNENRLPAWVEKMLRSVTTLAVPVFFAVEPIDEVVDVKLCGPAEAVVLSTCAPPNHGVLLVAQMDEQFPSARSKGGAGKRVDEASVDVEDPTAHVGPVHVNIRPRSPACAPGFPLRSPMSPLGPID